MLPRLQTQGKKGGCIHPPLVQLCQGGTLRQGCFKNSGCIRPAPLHLLAPDLQIGDSGVIGPFDAPQARDWARPNLLQGLVPDADGAGAPLLGEIPVLVVFQFHIRCPQLLTDGGDGGREGGWSQHP